jgi:hypothetical protein
LYKTIRNITSDYEDSIPYYEKGQVFPNGYYQTYIKVFKDNLLYLYDSKNRNKPVYVYKLNNLGEFDFKNAEDIHLYPR